MPQISAGAASAPDASSGLNVLQLREKLKELGLSQAGSKAELAARYEGAITGGTAVVDGADIAEIAAEAAAAAPPEKSRRKASRSAKSAAPATPADISGAAPGTPADLKAGAPGTPAEIKRKRKAGDTVPATPATPKGGFKTPGTPKGGFKTPGTPTGAFQAPQTPGDAGGPSVPKTPVTGVPATPAELSKGVPATPAELSKGVPATPAELSKELPKTPAEGVKGAPETPLPGAPATPADLAQANPATPADLAKRAAPGTPADVAKGEEAPKADVGPAGGGAGGADDEMEEHMWKGAFLEGDSEDELMGSSPSKGQKRKRPADSQEEDAAASSRQGFEVGDSVKALYSDGKWYKATVYQDHGDDTFTIAWEDFENDGNSADNIKKRDELQKEGDLQKEGGWQDADAWTSKIDEQKQKAADDLATANQDISVGDSVKALYSDGKWYKAKVEKDNGDGTFTVAWEDFSNDGDAAGNIKKLDELQKEGAEQGADAWKTDQNWNQEDKGDKQGWEAQEAQEGGDEWANEKWKDAAADKSWNENEDNDWANSNFFPDLQQKEEWHQEEEPLQFREWPVENTWQTWEPNSHEAMTATYIVQKIRARTEAEWEKRMKVTVRGFRGTAADALVNGEYTQQGLHEGRPLFESHDGSFCLYCFGRKTWCIAPQLNMDPAEAWAESPEPPEPEEGQVKREISRRPPPGPWRPNLAFASGSPELSKCELAEPAFPSEEANSEFMRLITQQLVDQRILVAALQWVEANVLEVPEVPPELSKAVVSLLQGEANALQAVCKRVPAKWLLAKANSVIPSPAVRRMADTTVEELTKKLHEKLKFEDLAKTQEVVSDMLGHVPGSVRIGSLVHVFEFAHLQDRPYGDAEALAVALARQSLPERAIEMTCRLTLQEAIWLADKSLGNGVDKDPQMFRVGKISVLNRLYQEWELNPSEEQLAQLHVFDLQQQLRILLLIERDIERYWARVISPLKSEEERSNKLRTYLDFDKLLQKHLGDDSSENSLETESNKALDVFELAKARKSVSDVLKKLKKRYGYSPSIAARVKMSKTNWVARLSALLLLAGCEGCPDADLKLLVLLQQEAVRKLGTEVLTRFEHWYALETGEGMTLKMPRTVDRDRAERIERKYSDYEPEQGRRYGPQGYQPMTPAGLGMFSATPGTPRIGGMTPGWNAAAGTPFRPMSGTPAGPPPMTPAGAPGFQPPGTPAGPPPATPFGAYQPPGTPAGPPPATPGLAGFPAGRTPAGPPPATPGFRPPGTPAGPPPATPFAARQPMGVPQTPVGAVPGTPAGAVPSTPRGAFMPSTPAGGSGAMAGAVPMTPAMDMRIPSTPVGAGAMTPRPGAVPSTPRAFVAGAVPGTPRGAIPGTPSNMVPMTPAGMGPGRPGQVQPFTPSGVVPTTPRGLRPFAGPGAAGPGAAAPQTPIGAAVPGTPGGAMPFTPAGPAPSTPAMPQR